MADPELLRQLAAVRRTLELIAFLLAVLLFARGGLGVAVGGGAAVLLVLDVLFRSPDRPAVD